MSSDSNLPIPQHRTIRRTAPAWAAVVLAAAAVGAQPPPKGPPDRPGEAVAFEVQSIDRKSWVVTARDLESGETFSFRLPPEAFRGQRFQADLGGSAPGTKVSVQAAPGARLDRAVIERSFGDAPGDRSAGEPRFDRDTGSRGGPTGYRRPSEPSDRRIGSGRSGPGGGAGPGSLGGASSGPGDYEVVSVDARSWEVEARDRDGNVVTLEVDPSAFVGYRFEASVEDLRAGQGFELLATNDRPLERCCVVKSPVGR